MVDSSGKTRNTPSKPSKPVEESFEDKYATLQTAVQDLMCELRIGPRDLDLMSDGYSPDYSGVGPILSGSTCKIQISMVVAKKLLPHVQC